MASTETASLTANEQRDAPELMRRLVVEVYAELRRLAQRARSMQPAERTIDTTGLVHEAWIRLAQGTSNVRDREHFLALAARIMRQVIVDRARERMAQKRGGGSQALPLDAAVDAETADAEEILMVSDALDRLAKIEPRQAQLVECRFFGGLSEHDAALALGISARTAARDWESARTWLAQAMQ